MQADDAEGGEYTSPVGENEQRFSLKKAIEREVHS
jgi:hypothetical protein